MAKAKKSKKTNVDAVYARKAAAKVNPFAPGSSAVAGKKLNPFEVHVNKEKFQILGRTCKHDKGLPGVSRAKAVKRRKETLGREYQEKHKTNQFHDRRIGKHFNGVQLNEDVMNARFMAEKMAQMKQGKSSRFNLNDDEVLTHRGQTLEEIEQFHDERSDDDEADDMGLDADFTEAAHFGGDAAQAKDRKSAIDEMILEQKKRKLEIAKEKDEIHDLTDKLDSSYKNLMGLMGKISKSEMKAKPEPDDYDKIMREMIFEPRGVVSDKLISVEDLAKKEKNRLGKLEQERLKRMMADGEDTAEREKPSHRSADDLDDGYFAAGDEEEDDMLAYNLEGELNTKLVENVRENVHEESHEESNVEDQDEDDDDDNDDNDDEEAEEESDEDSEKNDESDDEDEEDNLSDLKDDSDNDEEAEAAKNEINTANKNVAKNTSKQKENKTVRLDLPFTIEMPTSYEEFHELLHKHTPVDQATIVERIIKCNHPKLEGANREKVVKLFAFILQYINELFADATQENVAQHFKILAALNPHLYDLIHLNPERMSTMLLNVIKEKHTEFSKNPKVFPSLETCIYFKLVSNYFSTSDFRHPLVTPCYIFIQHILSRARVRTRQDIALGLFLVTVSLEYSQLSKRFLPASLNYLLGVLYISIPKRPVEVLKIVPPFESMGTMSKLLTIAANTEASASATKEELLTSEDLVMYTFSTDFRIRALNTTLKLIENTMSVVADNIGANYLAEPLLEMLERLPLDAYPEYVHTSYENAKETLTKVAHKSLVKLVPPAKKPKALRLYEPRIETVYDDKRRPKTSKEKEEKLKLVHKLKRETKGAVREIRRDTEFLQKIRLQQQIQSDKERKEKVKRIYQEAAMQQGELNELARSKKKKKF